MRRRLRVLHSRHLADRPTRLPRPKLGSADRLVFESVPSVVGRSAVVQIFTRRSTKRGGNPPSRPRPSARPLNAWSDRGRPTSRKGKGVRDVITNSRVPAPPNELPSFRLPIHNMSFPPLLLFSSLPPADEQNSPFGKEFRSGWFERTKFRFIGFISGGA